MAADASLPDLPADQDPVAIRQPDIEHRDAGAQRRNPDQRRGRGAALADHLNVRLGLEKAPDPPADDLQPGNPDGILSMRL